MKPAAFDYIVPRTVPEAVEALGSADGRAQILAGGQSLILDMRLQRLRPELVVDINRIAGLDRMSTDGSTLRVGALVRHDAFVSARSVPGPLGALFARAAPHIAHPPIRSRGTMVGSFAWAHPASEWCAIGAALDADVELRGPEGRRAVPARDYFHGRHLTARRPDEMLTGVRFPLLGDSTGVGFIEHRRTHFCFAQVAVAAALTVRDGVISEARIGLVNCADRPVRAHAAEQVLIGAGAWASVDRRPLADGHPFARAGRIAAEQDAAPRPEPYADVEYKRHTVAVLVTRTLCQAVRDRRSRLAGPEGEPV
ncbi:MULTISPECIES: FAD binding domain-containing protein [unclassified Streptomyces]|uniref:FAD binding domain-containing protein n=1 Tax=unclassified Streptomyces TaxID=2593676 RepID=UPI00093C38FB|nr:FAD binding domain-containing protein [Streptomyces sp. CB01580]OKJ25898.1 molybdopterin dehydrogenase [Streptomyces sp. CB01580]